MEGDRYGGGSVMVWGGVSTDLHVHEWGTLIAQRYHDEALDPIVRPYAAAFGEGFILMHNNARPNTALSGSAIY